MPDYLTDDEIVQFIRQVDSSFVIEDLPSITRASTYEYINNVTNQVWEVSGPEDIYLDGQKTKRIFSTKIPIVTLTEIAILDREEEEELLDFSGKDRQVAVDYESGALEILSLPDGIEVNPDEFSRIAPVWPEGLQNIRINGTFGFGGNSTVKYVQMLLILKQLSLLNPQRYKTTDIIMEKIGKYQYELTGKSTTRVLRRSIDEWIDILIDSLPKGANFCVESV